MVIKLQGDAHDVIKWYSLTDENYAPALKALKDKYGNEQKLIDAYIDELLNLRVTASNMTLRKLFDQLLSIVNMLVSLKVGREQFAVVLVPMMRSVLPNETKLEYPGMNSENCAFLVRQPNNMAAISKNRTKG